MRVFVAIVLWCGLLVPATGNAAPPEADSGAHAAALPPYDAAYREAQGLLAQARTLSGSSDPAERAAATAKFRAAHRAFVDLVERDEQGAHVAEAARGQMFALRGAQQYVEASGRSRPCTAGGPGRCGHRTAKRRKNAAARPAFEVTEYTPDDEAMLAAYALYDAHVTDPDDPERPGVEYHRCRIMMTHNRFDEAVPRLQTLVTEHDGSVHAAWAWEMLLDVLTIRWTDRRNTPKQAREAAEALETWARRVVDTRSFAHREAARLREAVPILLSGLGWRKAERLEEQGRGGQPAAFERCGDQYLSIFTEFDAHDRADELLFNAARCYEAGHLLGKAIASRAQLLSQFPESALWQQTVRILAENHQSIAQFGRAAGYLEIFADRYPKDVAAGAALSNAFLFREGVGDTAGARANLERYQGLFGAKRPDRAAELWWRGSRGLESDAEKLTHLRTYIRRYGTRSVDRRVVAEAIIGQILWRQSCRRGLRLDSCITVERAAARAPRGSRRRAKRAAPRRCERRTSDRGGERIAERIVERIVVHRRDRKLAKAAQRHFATALKLASREVDIPRDDPSRAAEYADAIGMSTVYAADEDLEDYLRMALAAGVPFHADPTAPASRRFHEHIEAKRERADALAARYSAVASTQSPRWTIAAAARIAAVSQHHADQYYAAVVPKAIATRRELDGHCDAVRAASAPADERARSALEVCLARSEELQVFTEFSRMCEEALHRRDPTRFPATHEIVGTAHYTRAVMETVGVQTEAPPVPDGP